MTALWCRSVAAPGLVRDCSSGIDQGWHLMTRRAEFARRRISVRQSPSIDGQFDLAEDEVDDAVDDLVLVRDVVVDRHRLDAELVGERADRQRSEPSRVGDREGAAEHPIPAERHAFHACVAG